LETRRPRHLRRQVALPLGRRQRELRRCLAAGHEQGIHGPGWVGKRAGGRQMIGEALSRGLVVSEHVLKGVGDAQVYPGRARRGRCLSHRLTDQVVREPQRERVPGRGLEQAELGDGPQAVKARASLDGRGPGKEPEVDAPPDERGGVQQISGPAIDAGHAVADDVPHGRGNARARHALLGKRAASGEEPR